MQTNTVTRNKANQALLFTKKRKTQPEGAGLGVEQRPCAKRSPPPPLPLPPPSLLEGGAKRDAPWQGTRQQGRKKQKPVVKTLLLRGNQQNLGAAPSLKMQEYIKRGLIQADALPPQKKPRSGNHGRGGRGASQGSGGRVGGGASQGSGGRVGGCASQGSGGSGLRTPEHWPKSVEEAAPLQFCFSTTSHEVSPGGSGGVLATSMGLGTLMGQASAVRPPETGPA